jgi:hypothetical protein
MISKSNLYFHGIHSKFLLGARLVRVTGSDAIYAKTRLSANSYMSRYRTTAFAQIYISGNGVNRECPVGLARRPDSSEDSDCDEYPEQQISTDDCRHDTDCSLFGFMRDRYASEERASRKLRGSSETRTYCQRGRKRRHRERPDWSERQRTSDGSIHKTRCDRHKGKSSGGQTS